MVRRSSETTFVTITETQHAQPETMKLSRKQRFGDKQPSSIPLPIRVASV